MSRETPWFSGTSPTDILSISAVEPLGPIAWQRLYRAFPTLSTALKAPKIQLLKAGLSEVMAHALKDRPTSTIAGERLLQSKNIRIVTIDAADYPSLLHQITDPPLWLFVRGSLSSLQAQKFVTIVGTRKPSAYALAALKTVFTPSIASELGVVSGLAYGIDKAAHSAALEANSPTVAVLAGGLDAIYPADHTRLAESIIASGGALISEYPPLSRPRPYRFPIRNRIIAGVTPLTIVVEASIKSGTLITARAALEYNRDVMAIPGDVTRQSAEGGNYLIKQGAIPLDSPEQLVDYFSLTKRLKSHRVDSRLQKLLDLVSSEGLTIDQLIDQTGQSVPEILGQLTELELAGIIYQPEPGTYRQQK